MLADVLLLDVHTWFAWVVVVGNGLAGLWALAAHWWAPMRRAALWWFTGAVQTAVLVEVVLGVVLVAGEGLEAPQFHQFYGFVAVIAVVIVYSYRAQLAAYRYLLYGGGGLFVMGLAIRAMTLS